MRTTVIMPKPNYKELTDREIVALIIAIPHNEEAAYYFLADRYRGLMIKMYRLYFGHTMYWFEDGLHDLFISLRGSKGDWNSFSNFQWRANLGTWLRKVSMNHFLDYYLRVIEKLEISTSIDNDDGPQIVPLSDDDPEHRLLLIQLLESVGKLKDQTQKFCILKHLQGYKHKDIAIMLKKKWEKEEIKKYNDKNELIIPDAGYVNVKIQRAKEDLHEIMLNKKKK